MNSPCFPTKWKSDLQWNRVYFVLDEKQRIIETPKKVVKFDLVVVHHALLPAIIHKASYQQNLHSD